MIMYYLLLQCIIKRLQIGKKCAADVTADTLEVDGTIKPTIGPLDSALKIGRESMLWCCLVVVSTRLATRNIYTL